ncbi:SepM family pheromone-processing serine protease [Bacillus horti]|uniref:endopeptidase La n=1 Tax=Caldalkalibacillus horti TaxID=77523 RepID=A0ABT9VUB3_9BACI|nr:SepM family pheromone-processing serine protease [Bacillus horti]MDQ0164577.1 PDZ domain-containing protein [Bacillus horti]
MNHTKRNNNRLWLSFIVLIIILTAAYFYPLPYFISSPGAAVELSPIIEVENGYSEQGTFMLTTVRMSGANVFNYALAQWDEYRETIPKEALLRDYKDESEYTERQLFIMKSSQETAISVAYELAGREVIVSDRGVMVVATVEGMPAEQHLKFGDIITSVDDRDIATSEELIAYVRTKQEGDEVRIKYRTNMEEKEITLALSAFPHEDIEGASEEQPRAGIGISTMTKQEIEVNPPVSIDTRRIGGPSAGLMFTLEIYNQLTPEDITKGYAIAGTGTMNPEGKVGRIGGIHQKIVAAHKAGADIFFAPYEEGAEDSNYNRAVEAAEDIKTSMKVVPVDTVQDALDYLESLPSKD